jgi:hypothetical protein
VVLVGCESTEGLIKERNALAVQLEKNATWPGYEYHRKAKEVLVAL